MKRSIHILLCLAGIFLAGVASAAVDTVPGGTAVTISPWSGTAYSAEIDDGDSGSADTIDFSAGNLHKSTVTGNVTYTFTAPAGPAHLTLRLIQDGAGSHTLAFPASVLWESGSEPTWNTSADSVSVLFCYFDGASYLCSALTGLE